MVSKTLDIACMILAWIFTVAVSPFILYDKLK